MSTDQPTPNPQPTPTIELTNLTKQPQPKSRSRSDSTPKKSSEGRALDWAATHGPISGTLSAATGCAAVALTGAAAGMPAGWPLAVGATGALGHLIGSAFSRKRTLRSVILRAASWLSCGAGTSWAIYHGPLTWGAAGTLAALAVGVGAGATYSAMYEEAVEEVKLSADVAQLAADLNAERRAIRDEWNARIERVTGVKALVFAVELWPSGGYSIAAELPGGTATWKNIAQRADALAADARLPIGCAINIQQGDVQGRVVLDIPTENVLAETYDYPLDLSPLSILDGVPWGLRPTMQDVVVFLREACALVVGPPGSGKSTFMDVVIAGFNRCVDVLPWVIDLKAGAIARPWMAAWLEAQGHWPTPDGETPAPADTPPGVDWIASTPEEALLMLKAALIGGAARQHAYQQLMIQQNTTLLPISKQIPMIEIIVDEGAELLSAQPGGMNKQLRQLREFLLKAMRTLRAMGIRMVLTAVDGTVSAIGDTQVRKYSPLGVILTSGDSNSTNIDKLLPGARVDTTQLQAKGSGVIGQAGADGFAPGMFKGWRTTPRFARHVTIETRHLNPTMDHATAHAMGAVYADRWSPKRAGWLWEGATLNTDIDPPVDATENDEKGSGAAATATPATGDGGLPPMRFKSLTPSQDNEDDEQSGAEDSEADRLAAEFMRQIDQAYGTTDEPDTDGSPHDGVEGGLRPMNLRAMGAADNPASPAASAGPTWLDDAIRAIRKAGPTGLKVAAVADLVMRDRKTVRAALQDAVSRGELIYRDNGPHSVYVHPDQA